LGLGYASLAKQRSTEAPKHRSTEAAKHRSTEAPKHRSSEAAALRSWGSFASPAWNPRVSAEGGPVFLGLAKRRKATQSERRLLTRLGDPPSVLSGGGWLCLPRIRSFIFQNTQPPCLAKALPGQLCERMRGANQSCYTPSITLAFDPRTYVPAKQGRYPGRF